TGTEAAVAQHANARTRNTAFACMWLPSSCPAIRIQQNPGLGVGRALRDRSQIRGLLVQLEQQALNGLHFAFLEIEAAGLNSMVREADHASTTILKTPPLPAPGTA